MKKILFLTLLLFTQQGCVGMVIGTAADAAIAVAKVPFKVGGAIIDVITDDDDEDE